MFTNTLGFERVRQIVPIKKYAWRNKTLIFISHAFFRMQTLAFRFVLQVKLGINKGPYWTLEEILFLIGTHKGDDPLYSVNLCGIVNSFFIQNLNAE